MKRKGKIITTIASLCLAVALMAFGVYAATTVSMGVTSKISYVVEDVFVTISGNAKKSVDGTTYVDLENGDLDGVGATATYAEAANWTLVNGVKTPKQLLDEDEVYTDEQSSFGTWNIGEYKYDSQYRYFQVTINITNNAEDRPIYVAVDKIFVVDSANQATSVTNKYKVGAAEQYSDLAATANNGYAANASDFDANSIAVPAGQTLTLVLTRTLNNTARSIAATNSFTGETTGDQAMVITMKNDTIVDKG